MGSKTIALFLLILTSSWMFSVTADELPRRASWQAKFQKTHDIGVTIIEIEPASPLLSAGFKPGDQLLAVNGQTIDSQVKWDDTTDALVADKPQLILYKRNNQVTHLKVVFEPVAKESYTNLDVTYDSVVSDYGIRQRVIITKPKSKKGAIPSIILVQGLSCSSVESLPWSKSNYIRLLRDIVTKSNQVVLRVEKPGMGDSEGNCSQTDFTTELSGYDAAINKLKSLPFVDANRIVIYGSSMGSALAPYLARKHELNGVISDGTFFRSWFEHMLEIERRIKTMQDVTQADLNEQMIHAYIPLYYGMLVQKKSYRQLIEENPLLAKYNYHGLEHMYGRPMSYYHQLQEFNFAGAWQQIKVPVRVRWGTNDWIMSEADNDIIAKVLKHAGHKNFKLYKYPGLDHWETVHSSAKNSFNGEPGKWEDKISQQVIDWANEINRKTWRNK